MLTDHPEVVDYLDVIGHQRYGPQVAVPRLLRMLDRRRLRTTFFVPGWVAETWPDVVRSIRDAGHEIGHHGYMHESVRGKDEATEEGYLTRGLEALDSVLGAPADRLPGAVMRHEFPDARPAGTQRLHLQLRDDGFGSSVSMGVRASSSCRCTGASTTGTATTTCPGYATSPILAPSVVVRCLGRGARGDRRGRWPVRPDDAPVRQRPAGSCRRARGPDRAGAVDGGRLGRGRATRSPPGSGASICRRSPTSRPSSIADRQLLAPASAVRTGVAPATRPPSRRPRGPGGGRCTGIPRAASKTTVVVTDWRRPGSRPRSGEHRGAARCRSDAARGTPRHPRATRGRSGRCCTSVIVIGRRPSRPPRSA